MTHTRKMTRQAAEAELHARELVEQIVEQEPRLRAARDARRSVPIRSAIVQSLKALKQPSKRG
jgi:hypothetical protein